MSVELGFRIPIVSGILELYSGLQSSAFRIPQTKISRILDSEFPYMGHDLTYDCLVTNACSLPLSYRRLVGGAMTTSFVASLSLRISTHPQPPGKLELGRRGES